MFYERIHLDRIEAGRTTFNAVPHFMAMPKENLEGKPAFYLEDEIEIYTGYLQGLNPRDVDEDREYKLIVRGVGNRLRDSTFQVFLEERVEKNDLIHVPVIDKHNKHSNKLVGGFLQHGDRFPRYTTFMYNRTPKNEVISIGDFVYGRVKDVKNNNLLELAPISIVSKSRGDKWKNRIIRATRS